jgi:hypothetical protein
MRRLLAAFLLTLGLAAPAFAGDRWSVERANRWQTERGWHVGCNYIASSAINQLEMFQGDTFDPDLIDRELSWAESLGFNSVRVYLHHLLWEHDSKGLLDRLDKFLALADRRHISVMFVLFDSVWDPYPRPGKQPEPRPHVHNSGWVQSPGADVLRDSSKHAALREYVVGVVGRFARDRRVDVWDVWNEPENPNTNAYGKVELRNKAEIVLPLLKQTFAWAREADPLQPLTSGVWIGRWADEGKLTPMERLQLGESDVISFHNYGRLADLRECVRNLSRYQRPLLCTEYMARPNGSRFEPHLAWMKEHKVDAYNWGFVAGKSQTIYPWDSWRKQYSAEPPEWFHDIFRADGSPFREEEVAAIRKITGGAKPRQ